MDKDNFVSFADYKEKIMKQIKNKSCRKKSIEELRENARKVDEKIANGEMKKYRETIKGDIPDFD